MVLLERALREIHRQAPRVSVTIVPLRDRMEKLENPAIDLVILPRAHVPHGRSCIPLFTDAFTAIVAADHPTVGTALSVDDYRSLGHVVVTFASDRAVSDDQVAAVEAGLTPRIAVVAPSYLALPGLVVGTTHVATIQRRLATHLAAHPEGGRPAPRTAAAGRGHDLAPAVRAGYGPRMVSRGVEECCLVVPSSLADLTTAPVARSPRW